jgi:hypothetical protein
MNAAKVSVVEVKNGAQEDTITLEITTKSQVVSLIKVSLRYHL